MDPMLQPDEEALLPDSRASSERGLRLGLLGIAAASVAAIAFVSRAPSRHVRALGNAVSSEFAGGVQSKVQAGYGQCGAMEPGIDYITEHTKSLPAVNDMQTCCARCQATPTCTAWTWVQQTGLMSMPASECFIKGGVMTGRRNHKVNGQPIPAGLISGNATGRVPPMQGGAVPVHLFNYQALRSGGPAMGPPACPQPGAPLPMVPQPPPPSGAQIRVLSFNLEWWDNFDKGHPSEQYFFQTTQTNAGIDLLRASLPFDIMGFQECLDVNWMLAKAGMSGEYDGRQGPEEVCVAWRKSTFQYVGDGFGYVSEDKQTEFWRKRGAQWLKLVHTGSGRNVVFINHHGPLPRDTGGSCGGVGTATNILSLIASQAKPGDAVVLLGDFNSGGNSQTIQALSQRMNRNAFGTVWGGLDNIFSNLDAVSSNNLGNGGSDHQAMAAMLSL